MTHSNDNTLTGNGKHLSIKDRDQIEILNKEGYSNRRIANLLGFAPQTIHNEV
ncbi:helix-turn-helix domain-containing protein, partial [Marinilactibacillus psychrotolerans]